jgi:two-component sensor histidine kinase
MINKNASLKTQTWNGVPYGWLGIRAFKLSTWLWRTLGITVIILLGTAVAFTALRYQVDESRRIETLLVRLHAHANQLGVLEWQAIAEQELTREISEQADTTRAQMEAVLNQLLQLSPNRESFQEIADGYNLYTAAIDKEFHFLASGEIEKARTIRKESVDLTFAQLKQSLSDADADASLRAEQTNSIIDLLLLALVIGALGALTFVVWRFHKTRHAVELALAEQRLLQNTQAILERSVQQRTLELTDANRQLQREIAQRAQAECELQQATAALEERVAERTMVLQSANAQLSYELGERRRAEEKISHALREKEVLLKEFHHGVKNNLQVISSLLYRQTNKIQDAKALDIFRDSQNRVRSMALIHEKLYQAQDLAHVDLDAYIHSLIGHLFRSYGAYAAAIRLQVNANNIHLGIDSAMPCGLIINELVSNALKHAFPNKQGGEIQIECYVNQENQFTLSIFDNGIGLPTGINFQSEGSVGLQLVNTLVHQLNGTLDIQHARGTTFIIRFAKPK